jgi:uncharacterized membrane protein
LYGRLPECVRLWRAKELLSLKGCSVVSHTEINQQTKQAYLGTGLAVVRLLAGVHALVDGQSGTLNELLATVRVVTDVRSVSCVNTF